MATLILAPRIGLQLLEVFQRPQRMKAMANPRIRIHSVQEAPNQHEEVAVAD